MADRNSGTVDGAKHGIFPAHTRLFGIVRQFPALPLGDPLFRAMAGRHGEAA